MSSRYGHLACRWLALAVFCTGHGPLQFPAEVWRVSMVSYTQALLTNNVRDILYNTDVTTNIVRSIVHGPVGKLV